MNNITSSGVCENWNSPNNTNNINNNSNTNPSMVSYVGLQNNSYKQFWDWETNTNTHTPTTSTTTNLPHNQNVNPFMNTQTNFYDYTNLSSLPSSTFNDNFFPTSQFNDYSPAGFLKKEDDDFSGDGGNYYNNNGGRIGLNLGHRTYFSSRETALIDRLFRRPRGFYQANQVPRCQAEGCKIDLTNAKHYHRRHKVCEYHSKATKVVAGGLEQRFCQQCSRFHVLAEFDQAKRSCRKRLADHNRRRRKPQIGQTDSVSAAKTAENASTSRSEQHKEMSLSSSANLPLMISPINNNNNTSKGGASTTDNTPQSSSGTQFGNGGGPALSLGGDQDHRHHQNQQVDERSFIFNQHSSSSSADMFHSRETTTVAPYHHNLFSPPHHVGSNQGQHPDDLQSLLHMRQNMFEVELL